MNEGLYEAVDADAWTQGARIGSLNGMAVQTAGGRSLVHVMRFSNDDTLVLAGSLTFEGKPTEGRLAVTGGTDRFEGCRGEALVEYRNPHKYTVTLRT